MVFLLYAIYICLVLFSDISTLVVFLCQILLIYKHDSALNNPQGLIYQKTELNIYMVYTCLVLFSDKSDLVDCLMPNPAHIYISRIWH